MTPVTVQQGHGPIVLGQPHVGTDLPQPIARCLNDNGLKCADTDWHIDRLYDGLLPDATIVKANFHRYVIDANRDPSGSSLYPGQNTTGLCPLTDFDGEVIYKDGQSPTVDEIEARRVNFHAPYHAALAQEIARVKALHGYAIMFDCHSIRSRIPFLFEGELPQLNIGTDGGRTCASAVEVTTFKVCAESGLTHVMNGRFRGGWTTRHYGRPQEGVHAIQMEIAQSAYLAIEAPPWDYDPIKSDRLRLVLKTLLTDLSTLKGLAP
jgi:N-formylglutamate deformylase